MPRTARAAVGAYCYCVIDRGNGCAVVFRIKRLDERIAALLGSMQVSAHRLPAETGGIVECPRSFLLVLFRSSFEIEGGSEHPIKPSRA